MRKVFRCAPLGASVLLCAHASLSVRAQEVTVRAEGSVASIHSRFASHAPDTIDDVTVGESMVLTIEGDLGGVPFLAPGYWYVRSEMAITMDIGGRVASGTAEIDFMSHGGPLIDGAGFISARFVVPTSPSLPVNDSGVLYAPPGTNEFFSLFAGLPSEVLPGPGGGTSHFSHEGEFLTSTEVFGSSGPWTSLFQSLAYGLEVPPGGGASGGIASILGELTSVEVTIVPSPGVGGLLSAACLVAGRRRRDRW
ncbi:MAG: hypothetical protein ACF8GE_01475 [Phycisphaerales bacterium JB043]